MLANIHTAMHECTQPWNTSPEGHLKPLPHTTDVDTLSEVWIYTKAQILCFKKVSLRSQTWRVKESLVETKPRGD